MKIPPLSRWRVSRGRIVRTITPSSCHQSYDRQSISTRLARLLSVMIALILLSGAFATKAHSQPRPTAITAWGIGSAGYGDAMRLSDGTKPVIVYFYADWCPFCKRLNSQILATPEVESYLGDVIRVKINPESGDGERALSELYKVKAFPAFIILSPATGRQRMIHPFHKGVGMSPAQFVDACREAMAYVSQ
ncbi:MAG: hypothetical protein JWQ98_3485 [Chlorobi bacterium]|nr:hypothetical protein [Chlorobiota bacterium]